MGCYVGSWLWLRMEWQQAFHTLPDSLGPLKIEHTETDTVDPRSNGRPPAAAAVLKSAVSTMIQKGALTEPHPQAGVLPGLLEWTLVSGLGPGTASSPLLA